MTIAFGGDVHFEGVIERRLSADPFSLMEPVAPLLSAADLAMVNLETAITTRGTAADKEFTFRAPRTAFDALRAAGVDVVSLANNHGMDYGRVGLADTLSAARDARFPLVGAGQDEAGAYRAHVVTARDQRIAFIGASQVIDDNLVAAWVAGPGKPGLASAYRVDRLVRAVREARAVADTVVVYLHWGKERETCPIARQRALVPKLVEAGADIVVGSHAHVLLGTGRFGKSLVSYGLGNFVFYARGGAGAQTGVLTVSVTGRDVDSYRWAPAVISNGVPQPLTGSAATAAVTRWAALRRCTDLAA